MESDIEPAGGEGGLEEGRGSLPKKALMTMWI